MGGAIRSRSASSVAIASTAPAAPSRCPIADLVELTGTDPARSPSAALIAPVSARSFSGVEVPWAFTYATSAASTPASSSASSIARAAPRPSGSGAVRW